jgi:hypothetical protein
VAPTTSGWKLASYASLLSACFFRDHSGPVCPFQCQTLERWLEVLPSGDCEAHSAEKRLFPSYARILLLQLDASSHLFGCCGLQSLHSYAVSFKLASRRLPVPPVWLPLPPRWSVVHLLVLFHVSAARALPRLFSVSVMLYAVWLGVMISQGLGCPPVHCLTRDRPLLVRG